MENYLLPYYQPTESLNNTDGRKVVSYKYMIYYHLLLLILLGLRVIGSKVVSIEKGKQTF